MTESDLFIESVAAVEKQIIDLAVEAIDNEIAGKQIAELRALRKVIQNFTSYMTTGEFAERKQQRNEL